MLKQNCGVRWGCEDGAAGGGGSTDEGSMDGASGEGGGGKDGGEGRGQDQNQFASLTVFEL